MKRYMQGLLCLGAMAPILGDEIDIIQAQREAIMQEITEKLHEQTLSAKQMIKGCTVNKKWITRQHAEALFHHRLRGRSLEEKPYILISVSPERKRKTLGGGVLLILYDKDTYENLASYRTR